ncbi:unnamed protein product [Miscanthus lutarioriparius]|uniref:F-box protein AT5G49610-like beta-propeller domain-containing protein n=1 Tax=Miscanthus lutarioriparius TaxID=422564 RepID=A0A811Q497_9POAL|nr:unnamed protein product [Miscanthus lutarioriparius]
MSSNVMELPPPPAEEDTTASDVLTNGDLLDKILLRFGCRSCLVSAALTSKHWLRAASGLFVPDFCVRHRPRLLGVYVSSCGISGSEFIPLLEPDVLNHADFGFGNLPVPNVWDCRNAIVLFEFGGETFHHAGRGAPAAAAAALCYRVNVRTWDSSDNTVTVMVCVLRSGSWGIHCIATDRLTKSPVQILPTTVLAGGKIYMATQGGYILGLKLATKGFFIVDLPEGVEHDQYPGNFVHCRGDDSVLYLFHVDGDNMLNNVWLRRMNDDHGHGGAGAAGGSTNGWVLRDTISVRETCGHLMEQGWETAGDEDVDAATVMVIGAGDNAEFVFLELGITGIVVYTHIKIREAYQREPDDDYLISVRPFMFIRPPVFPVQDALEGEAAPHQE